MLFFQASLLIVKILLLYVLECEIYLCRFAIGLKTNILNFRDKLYRMGEQHQYGKCEHPHRNRHNGRHSG